MNVIFLSLSHKYYYFYGKGNSQNVAPVGDLSDAGNTCGVPNTTVKNDG